MALVLAWLPVSAAPVLHEALPLDPAEDLSFGATPPDGELPAAIQTTTGPVSVPEEGAVNARTTYGGVQSGGSGYRLDSNTVGPDSVRYSEPFTPAIVPFKRSGVFDAVAPDMQLIVHSPQRVGLPIGGVPTVRDDQFYGDMTVDLVAERDVKIPSVAPGARILSVRLTPPVAVVFHRDSAENWFVRSEKTQRVRLVMHLAVDRSVFSSPYGNVSWRRLSRELAGLPPDVQAAGARIASGMGVSQNLRPKTAVRRLIEYFRDFSESPDRPTTSGIELYETIARSQIGVCRHRAFAFTVTALAVGIPARFVHNEAHAWVEVSDGYRWHRVDLGGAAARLNSESPGNLSVHQPPQDSYRWPAGSFTGQNMADAERSARGNRAARSGAGAALPRPHSGAAGGAGGATLTPGIQPGSSGLPASDVSVVLEAGKTTRGARIRVSGVVSGSSGPCASVRIDVVLNGYGLQARPLGALVTDARGRYDGFVLVPSDVVVGDYDVQVHTPGSPECGQGTSDE